MQNGFVKGRYILDNEIIIWEGMEWDHSFDHEALFIKIDFEKVYDQIEWNFIFDMLHALGLVVSSYNLFKCF